MKDITVFRANSRIGSDYEVKHEFVNKHIDKILKSFRNTEDLDKYRSKGCKERMTINFFLPDGTKKSDEKTQEVNLNIQKEVLK